MWRHEIIDGVLSQSLVSSHPGNLFNIVQALKNAHEFNLGEIDSSVDAIAKAECGTPFFPVNGPLISPPFPTTLFTWKVCGGKHAIMIIDDRTEDIRRCQAYQFGLDGNGSWAGINPIFLEIKQDEMIGYPIYNFDNSFRKKCESSVLIHAYVADYACRVMAAKNVHIQKHEPSASLNRKRIRRGDTPAESYSTLAFSAPGQTITSDRKSTGENSGLNALHLCRGHMRYVSEDRPLFGRAGCSGWFWIQAHARGKRENGVRHKDYAVKLEHAAL